MEALDLYLMVELVSRVKMRSGTIQRVPPYVRRGDSFDGVPVSKCAESLSKYVAISILPEFMHLPGCLAEYCKYFFSGILQDLMAYILPQSVSWAPANKGWLWFLFVYDWDTVVLAENATVSAYGLLSMCYLWYPCAFTLRGGLNSEVQVLGGGQISCLSSTGCIQISITSVVFVCINNTKSVFKMQNSALSLSKVSFTGCRSDTDGGIVQAYDIAEVVVQSGNFTNISSSGFGGAFAAYGSNLSISDSRFHNCSARSGGGAVWSSAFQNYYGSTQIQNTHLHILTSVFSSCSTSGTGGAILAVANSASVTGEVLDVFITSTHISHCTAMAEGGALRISGNPVLVEVAYSNIDSCWSQASGGAISSSDFSSLTLVACSIYNNTALGMGGGAIHLNQSYFSTFNISTGKNRAPRGGGGGLLWQGWVNSAFIECPEGHFLVQIPCASVTMDLSAATSACQVGSCQQCIAGSFRDTKEGVQLCYPCISGTFSDVWGASSCISCPVGKYSSVVGANTPEVCAVCLEGLYSDVPGSSACAGCPAGTFSSVKEANTSDVCSSCTAGTYSSSASASSSSVCEICSVGAYSDIPGSSLCTSCPAGTFSLFEGANSSNACGSCGAGMYSSLDGANNSSVCLLCGPGSFTSKSGSTSCKNCPAGTFSPVFSANGSDVCSSCAAGQYASVEGASSSSVCVNCEAGAYSDAPGSSSCIGCPAGTFSGVEGANISDACSSCAAGQYASVEGASSPSVCVFCEAGAYSDAPGSSSCIGCPAGTFSGVEGANISDACSSCAAGQYASVEGASSSSVCAFCDAATFSNLSGSSACVSCPAGTFSGVEGANSLNACSSCGAGQYASIGGSSICSICAPGTYTEISGSSACVSCPAGTFSPMEGANSSNACRNCAAGQYASVNGANSSSVCIICGAGSYTDMAGSSTCTQCPSGQTSLEQGASSKDECTFCWPRASSSNISTALLKADRQSSKGQTFPILLLLGSGSINTQAKIGSYNMDKNVSQKMQRIPVLLPNISAATRTSQLIANKYERRMLASRSSNTVHTEAQIQSLLFGWLCGVNTSALYGPCIASDFWSLQISADLLKSVYSGVPFNFTVTKRDAYGTTIVSDSSSVLQAILSSTDIQENEMLSIEGSAVSLMKNGIASFVFAIKVSFSRIDYSNKSAKLYGPIVLSLEGVDSESGVTMNSGQISVEVQQGYEMCPPGFILVPDQQGAVNGPAVCTFCKSGTYSVSPLANLPGSSIEFPSCLTCPVGCNCAAGGADIQCEVGTWKAIDGIYILSGCPEGFQLINSTAGTAKGLFSNVLQQCRSCLRGQYIIDPDSDVCQDCPAGNQIGSPALPCFGRCA